MAPEKRKSWTGCHKLPTMAALTGWIQGRIRVSETLFRRLLIMVALIFCGALLVLAGPPLLENPDIIGAFAAGFVNPFAAGYATDVILCWVILAIWVLFERQRYQIRGGWLALVLGVVPGVAVGFALYLLMRQRQLKGSGIV